jgi:hypothetical protein
MHEAVKVFADNLRELLLAAPLGQKRVLGIDPGFRTGCKVVVLDAQGQLVYNDVIYLLGDGNSLLHAKTLLTESDRAIQDPSHRHRQWHGQPRDGDVCEEDRRAEAPSR